MILFTANIFCMSEEPEIFPEESFDDLRRAADEARALAEMKSGFLAMVSHEIRTPLQTIYGMLELIAQEEAPHPVLSMTKTAKNAASDLLGVLDDILDVLKMDAKKLELDHFEVPVRLLVHGIIEALAANNPNAKKVQILSEISPDVPQVVTGDPRRLRQILMNFAVNALNFTRQGTVTIHVTRSCQSLATPADGIGLRFSVSDTGIGIAPEHRARLFEPFFQAGPTTTRKQGGTGLGLSICKRLVDLMNGVIGVESEQGAGSTFWFEIPTQEVGTAINKVSLPDLDGISVLSVDSHPQGSKEISNSLQSMGAKVESCASYEEGVELARRMPFDVAVVDQSLPDGLGIHLMQELFAFRPYMGLIMYTARDDPGLTQSLKTLGAAYLTKPASRIGLGKAVDKAAHIRSKPGLLASGGGEVRILIAEDTESVRDILNRQCEKLGIQPVFAVNGKEALKLLNEKPYNLLICDLHMPDMDGYELVKTIRDQETRTGERLPVIALSADVMMAGRDVFLEHGFDESLVKPVTLGQLRRLLIRWGLLEASELSPGGVRPSRSAQYHSAKVPPALDRECVIGQMGAFDQSAIEMLENFVRSTDPLVTELAAAESGHNFMKLAETAHSLKGAARSACCSQLGSLAAQIEMAALDERPCANLIVAAVKEFGRARKEIANLTGDAKTAKQA
ncbi:MAG: response regulator [Rhodospirillales bacterium]|nr:response regulator [Rhodospirillales bacterium]